MLKYGLTRLAATIPLLLAMSVLVFLVATIMPGGIAVALLGDNANPETVADLETRLGLSDPLPVQYARWLGNALHGDLGDSWTLKEPVVGVIVRRMPVTLSLAMGGMLIGIILGLAVGIIAGLRPGSWLDRLITLVASIGVAMPAFWLAMLLAMYLAVQLRWFPAIGYTPLGEDPVKWLRSITLPCLALGLPTAALIVRQMRSSLITVLQSRYILAAHATGIPLWQVVSKYALRNALVPVVTVIGFRLAVVFSLSLAVEQVFNLPGIASITIKSVMMRDIPLLQGAVLLTACFVVVTNLIIDLSYGWLNPKVRLA
jgi:peptide/nickel transport system permease protein